MPIRDEFLDEHLLHIKTSPPWFTDICNFVAASRFPPEASRAYKDKIRSDAKYYIWDDPYLWRLCSDKVIRRCIPDAETNSVLQFYHSAPGGGHYGSTQTARKVLDCGLYWPTIFRDAHEFVSTCENCQKAGVAMNRRHEMPQQPIQFCEIFDVWGIDFMGPFPASNSRGHCHQTNDSRVVVDFLKSNIFCRFGVPKALISDQGSHFCNRAMASLFQKYGVAHKISTTYHPQTNGQAEVFTREIKKTLCLLEDALWAHRTTYQTPLGMSRYRIVFSKTCHLLVELEHKAYCVVKQCNLAYGQAGEQRKFQLQELDELRLEAYENSRIYKQKILRKEFHVGQKVLLFNSRLKLIAGKLRSRWDEPFVITNIFPNGAVQLQDEHSNNTFQVNGHQIKPFHEGLAPITHEMEIISTDPLYIFDPELELTLRRLRKIRNTIVNIGSSVNSATNFDQFCTDHFITSTNNFTEPGQMENHDRTLKELATPDVVYQPWCIQYPQLEPAQTYELKSGLIHLLPKFHGLAGEDPHKHLKEFHVVCSTMRPQGIPEDYIKMKAFPFSLDGAAKDWLYLQPALFNTWGDMKRTFLEKIFPASRTATIRKEICGIRQHTGETLHEYWERFNKLCATCPHHQISEQLLIQYFYKGLSMMDSNMIDAASGGALMDKTPVVARHLISTMASNTQQFGIRGPNLSRPVNEIDAVSNQRLENQLTELTSLVRQLAVSQHHPAMAAKVCGICTSVEHPTDLCPTLQETESGQTESVGAVGGFQYGKQPYQNRQFDNQPYGKQPFRPNPQPGPYAAQRAGYMPNAPYGAAGYQQPSSQYSTSSFPPQQQRTPTQDNSPSLEDLMKQLAASNIEFQQSVSSSNLQFQQNMTATIHDLKMQIGQLANTSAGSSSLPSQPIPNPRGNANAVTLRSGKELPQPEQHQEPQPAEANSEASANSQSRPETAVPLPFPSRTVSAKKPDSDDELLKMFRKVEINIPLLDAIKQIPKYAKFLKELCVHKRRKMKGSRELGGVVSSLTRNNPTAGISQVLPKKAETPVSSRSHALSVIAHLLIAHLLMLCWTWERQSTSLNFGDLEPTGMTIQLANRSIVQPLGVLEDVLVQVNELIFPTDFYVLDMEDEPSGKGSTLILGRPFLMTTRTKIDVHAGTLSMEFGDTLVQFNIFEAMKHPTEDHSLFGIDIMEELVEEYFQLDSCSEGMEDLARTAEASSCSRADHDEVLEFPDFEEDHSDVSDLALEKELTELINQVCYPEPSESKNGAEHKAEIMTAILMPSLEQAGQSDPRVVTQESPSPPPMELKPLPSHLKYAYLDSEQQLPVIIASNLLPEQEEKLLQVLRQHKKAIGWKLSDLPGINPSICMHRILMEEDIKPIRQQQRRLNPTLLDVVKKEVTRLLAAGIIYPISDSQWVSPVQVVPKKSGMTVMKNQHDELVPMRIQNSWR
ncbi:putative mitochondrial protein, partial [Mucuna pruriens]